MLYSEKNRINSNHATLAYTNNKGTKYVNMSTFLRGVLKTLTQSSLNLPDYALLTFPSMLFISMICVVCLIITVYLNLYWVYTTLIQHNMACLMIAVVTVAMMTFYVTCREFCHRLNDETH